MIEFFFITKCSSRVKVSRVSRVRDRVSLGVIRCAVRHTEVAC